MDVISSYSYHPLPKNPLQAISNKVYKAIKSSSLDPATQKRLVPLNPITPRIYGQPKIHKPNIPLRPIVSPIGGPTHSLSKYLAKKLSPYYHRSSSYIKDFVDFIKHIKTLKLDKNNIMVIFDVVSLFTKIPILGAIELISKLVDSETLNLNNLCLSTTFFTYDGAFYEQTKVEPWVHLSPLLSLTFSWSTSKPKPLKPSTSNQSFGSVS